MEKGLSIIIADDDSFYTWGIEQGLKRLNPQYKIYLASNGKQLIDMLAESKARIVILDYFMPVMDGLEATRIIREKHKNVKIIFTSLVKDPVILGVILEAGIHAYILKDADRNDLENALRAVMHDQLFLSTAATQTLVEYNQQLKQREKFASEKNKLTEVEITILLLMLAGMSTNEISERLNKSVDTINTYRHRVHEKTGAKTFAELTRYAILRGYITDLNFFTDTQHYVKKLLSTR